jgi:bifunctional enzyme CysN/CysC
MHDVVSRAVDAAGPVLRVNVAGDAGEAFSALFEHLAGAGVAASTIETDGPADIAVIVAPASAPLDPRTLTRIAVAAASGARHLVLAADMGSAPFDQGAFDAAACAFKDAAKRFSADAAHAVPVSARDGGNVAAASGRMPSPALLSVIETLSAAPEPAEASLRFPIAAVVRPESDLRLYRGTIASGHLAKGDAVQVAISGAASTVARIFAGGDERERAAAGEEVLVALDSHLDVGSGDMLVDPRSRPPIAEQFAARLAWLGTEPLLPGRDYTLHLGASAVTASVTAVKHRVDLATLHHEAARTLNLGEIGACTIATGTPIAIDAFSELPRTGRFVLTERHKDAIVAAGTVEFALRRGLNVHLQRLSISKELRAALKDQRPCVVWFTGLSGAGKSTIADLVERQLAAEGRHTYMLDGDNVRHGLNKDLGFTVADRVENIRRVGEVAKLFVDAPLGVCEERDPKGLYAKSRAGRLPNFTGIDSPYEAPERPDLVLETARSDPQSLAERVIALLRSREIVAPPPSDRR